MFDTLMNPGFWAKIKKPFFVLAPLADVTDTAFRELIAKYSEHRETHGGPDVFWTEFVSADGLASNGREVLKRDLEYTEHERPIVAQLFGSSPEKMEKASAFVKELGFDGIDINMGCPDRSIEKQSAGAAMIKNIDLAKDIIESARQGGDGLPVSVKTRIGYNKNETEEWLGELLSMNLPALTTHLRTRKEMSLVPAHWELMPKIMELAEGKNTLIIGNGDVLNIEEGEKKIKETGCDGVMIGRAIFGNPWFFNRKIKKEELTVEEKLKVMLEHTRLFEKKLGDVKSFSIMKKHYKAYVAGFDGSKELRLELMDAENANEVQKITEKFLDSIKK